jgi:hypothetical protein
MASISALTAIVERLKEQLVRKNPNIVKKKVLKASKPRKKRLH